jgi:transposase
VAGRRGTVPTARLHGLGEEMGGREDVLSWVGQNRRKSKDYERLPESSEAFIYVAMIRLMVRRPARS